MGVGAFYKCSNLESVTIPGSITGIEKYAFSGCEKLTNVEILEGVTSIGESMFEECSSLESIILPSSVTKIDKYAFYNCTELKTVAIPENTKEIYRYAFSRCDKLVNIIWNNMTYNTLEEFMNTFREAGNLYENYE
ncbi:leucine-rich repeat domain-containing protein [Lachnospiraceae bacterium BX3]|uniref:Leucine-rich repeat domain-containing protein n=1 Tax=Jutongia hominis TaxID=2763664 RepID=A0ABR7MRL0_9FIRM|nr:leucine-rich repeat domain-containing protein [Jutongia hominis]